MHAVSVYLCILKWPQIQSQSKYFSKFPWDGMPPDPPSITMPSHNGIEHIPRSPNFPYTLFAVKKYVLCPPDICYISF